MAFAKNFLWGGATAAHQIEGAAFEDGKSAGIWDALCPGHVAHGENGHVACDHYHRYKEDVAMMKKMGLKAYRFSISWPRVIPAPGVVNGKGLEFYVNLVEELTSAGIEPIVTLFHWNLPMWMYNKGGWENPEIGTYFADYVKVVVKALSHKVRWWITLNEPQCFIGVGYYSGRHAPFRKETVQIPYIVRNVMLAHGQAVKVIRKYAKLEPKIGFAPTGPVHTPVSTRPEDIELARAASYDEFGGIRSNAWWADPIVLGIVPEPLQQAISQEDLRIICQPLDFFAFNVYNSENHAEKPGEVNPQVHPGMPRTALNWPITPEVLYWASRFHYERYKLPILISENGMANVDFVMLDGKVHDPQRVDYIHRHLHYLKQAAEEGVPVLGYLYWSVMDNFEWALGYDARFGLVYVEYETQKRIWKDSAFDYRDIIHTNGDNL